MGEERDSYELDERVLEIVESKLRESPEEGTMTIERADNQIGDVNGLPPISLQEISFVIGGLGYSCSTIYGEDEADINYSLNRQNQKNA